MKRFKNLVLAVIVSPEVLIGLLIILGFVFFPSIYELIGNKIKLDREIWKYLPTLTLLLSGAALRLSSKMRAPLESSSNKALYEWPLYSFLVDRVIVSIFFACVSAIFGLMLWIVGDYFEGDVVGVVFLEATSIAGVTSLTMLLAHQKLREILERYS